jgi:hypothetical protein
MCERGAMLALPRAWLPGTTKWRKIAPNSRDGPSRSGYDDHLDADSVICTACARIPGRQGYLALFGGQCH